MGATHLKAWSQLPQAELAAVSDGDERRLGGDLSGVQGNIGGPAERMDFSRVAKYTDWREAVEDPNLDAVDICLPTNLHAEVAIAALRAGKHVLVEKPMALDAASVDAMLEAASHSGRILMTAQVLRFFPAYRAMAELVKSGSLGTARAATFRRRCAAPEWSAWLADKSASGGGVFDLLIHDVDMCLHVFGPPEAVSAVGYEDLARGIDCITAQFSYPQMTVVLAGGWHHPKSFPFSMEYTVTCDGGTIEYSSAGSPPAIYRADGAKTVLPAEGKDGYLAEIEYFVQCCVEEKPPVDCPPAESAAAVKLALLMLEARSKQGDSMPSMKAMEVGVMFWAGPDAAATIRRVTSAGVRCGQLGIPGGMSLAGAAKAWRTSLAAEQFTVVTVFAGYEGESYADIPTVQRTVGFIPAPTRAEREARTKELSDFAAELGVESIACHIGFVPEDEAHPDYIAVREMVRRVADHAAAHGQTFALETGQEPAEVLLHFLRDVDRPNLRINFDPANMILYGSGDPIEALGVLAPYVVSVHCKDGDWPPTGQPGALGTERPLGEGAVGIERFLAKLKQIGYSGTLNIEREVQDQEQKWRDVASAAELLKRLTA